MLDKILARIKELEDYRTRLVTEANAEVQRVTGAIVELTHLADELKASESTAKETPDGS